MARGSPRARILVYFAAILVAALAAAWALGLAMALLV